MKKLIVDKKYNNKKIMKYLQDHIENLSNNLFFKLLRKKDIKVNGKRINNNIIIFENDEIEIYIDDKLLEKNIDIDIVYEDSNILLINKPINIEVTGTNSLTSILHQKYNSSIFLPMPCHRLDRNTSGLILFAKNQKSLEILLNKFKKHEIEKHYLALVSGYPQKNEQTIISYLFKDRKKSMVYISKEPKKGYSKIITSYKLLKKNPNNTSLLDIEIETGKTHQIRAQLADIGLPIIGDGKYGDYEINKKFNCKTQKLMSYKIKFNFNSVSGILEYLNLKEFSLKIEPKIF